MALKAKSSDTEESSDNEDSKMKSYITKQFKKFMKNANGKGFDKDHRQSNSSQLKSQDRGKKDAREIVSTLFPQDISALGVRALVTRNRSVLHISRALGRARHLLLLSATPSLRMIPTIRMTES